MKHFWKKKGDGLMIASRISVMLILVFFAAPSYGLSPAVDDLLARYRAQGMNDFSAKEGEAEWNRPSRGSIKGETRKCASCHGTDLRSAGKHADTGRSIAPLAPSVNPKRLKSEKFIEKWFKRNCNWTFGRECTPKEKGDFLLYIQSQ